MQSSVTIRVSPEKKHEMKDAAKKAGISLTAYIVGLHNADIRRELSLNVPNAERFFIGREESLSLRDGIKDC